MHEIIVFSKTGCHLCERAIDILRDLSGKHKFSLEIVEITTSKELFRKYFLTIPVVRLDGKDVFNAEDIGSPAEFRPKLTKLVQDLENS